VTVQLDTTPTIELCAALLHEPDQLDAALVAVVDARPLPPVTEIERIDAGIEQALRSLGSAGERIDLPALRFALETLGPSELARQHADAICSRVSQAWTDYRPASDLVAACCRRVVSLRVGRRMRSVAADRSLSSDQIAARVAELNAGLPQPMAEKRTRARAAWRATVQAIVGEQPPRRAVPTGIAQLDGYLRDGLGCNEFTVFALGTNAGKSLWLGTLMRNIQWPLSVKRPPGPELLAGRLRQPAPHPDGDCYGLLVSLEDPAESVIHRWALDLADVDTKQLDTKELRAELLTGPRRALLDDVVEVLVSDDARIEVVDSTTLGSCRLSDVVSYTKAWAAAVRQRCAELGRPEPRLLMAVDYAQYIEVSPDEAKRMNREQQVAVVSRGLAGLAREEKVAVAASAMLGGRIGTDAALVDIRESGALEQAAHVVVRCDTVQGHADVLEAAVKIAVNSLDPHGAEVMRRRFALALTSHAAKIVKSRTTGGRGATVTWHVEWDRQRITQLSTDEGKLVEDLACDGGLDVVRWARRLMTEHQQPAGEGSKPKRRRKGSGAQSDEDKEEFV
jgi:hypothetical protein